MMGALVTWGKAVALGRKLVVGIAVLVVIVGAALIWWFISTSSAAAPDPAPTPVSTESAAQAAVALEALETDPESLLPDELAGTVNFGEAVPPGTEVTADPASWVPSDAGGGVIAVTLTYPDGTVADVAAVMVEEDDGWKVLQTIPLEDAP